MERHLYRFRTAERLLGSTATDIKTALPGELENLEIYFAPPEQLNDPLEGYKEVYWAGDEIIWRNFFRHYLLVLALRSWELDEAVRLGTPLPKNLPIEQDPSNLRGAFQAGYQEMDALIGGCDVIQGYVRALSKNEARHYRPELSFYLATLHTRLLSTVLLVNFKHGLSGVYPDQTSEDPLGDRDLHLQAISNIEAQDGTLRDAGSYEKMALLNATYAIRTAHVMPGGHIGARELITAFVPHYLDQIERLMYPQWYVACFMKECNNSAIWGSYGDNHRGICLRYRVLGDAPSMTMEMNKPDGRGYNGISHSFQNMSFKEVFYDREFSEMDFFRFLGNVSNEALSGFWYSDTQGNLSSKSEWLRSHSNELWMEHHQNIDFALTSKLPQWGSEKEYRLVLSSYLDISDKKHRILKYRFTSLDGLIFGIKTPLEDKLKCIRIIRAHCEREGIESFNFYQAYYDPQTKSIEHGLLPITLYEADPESEEPSGREDF
ncbi:DUF2971 domain-containing protein [Pseudomonas syringae]|uniref:DUF2971 domain-containing protein n=1 Tax=Pseudomonas syringae TaxID=317 RepID=UPI003F753701